MTKEEIKPIIILNNIYGESRKTTDVYYPVTVILEAMKKFAELKTEQETERLKAELNELKEKLNSIFEEQAGEDI